MRRLIFFSILLIFGLLSFGETSAQRQSQRDSWKELVSEEGGFKVKMPILPRRSVLEFNPAFGKTDLIEHKLITRDYIMSIGFWDFPSEINDQEEIDFRYNSAIAGRLGRSNFRVVSKKDIFYGEFTGREVVFENASISQTLRMFIIKQRVFIFEFSTFKRLAPNYRSFRDKFFNSFEITQIPKAKFEKKPLPEDLGVSIEGKIIRSSYFGFSMQIPDDYEFMGDEELNLLSEITTNVAELDNSIRGQRIKLSLKNSVIIAGALNQVSASSIIIGAERTFANVKFELAAEEIRKNILKKSKIIKDLYKFNLGDREYYGLGTQDRQTGQKQLIILTLAKELLFQVVLTYDLDSDVKLFEESLKTIRFE